MASDVEMASSVGLSDAHLSPPPSSPSSLAPTSRRSSLAVTNTKTIPINDAGSNSSISIPVLVHSPSPAPSHEASSLSGTTGPAPSAAAAGAPNTTSPSNSNPNSTTANKPPSSSTKPASSAKPRSSKPAKPARSPSPSPPPPAVPLQTIRLDIQLGGPSNYEVDIARQAKDTGQRPPTPPPTVKKVVADSSESEDEEEDKDKAKDGTVKSKTKKKKRNPASEYYDTTDPFIDDSELALDERQFFAQTKQQGFYVSSGEVALLKDKTPKKPKSKKISFATGLHPSLATDKRVVSSGTPAVEGSREAPIPIDGGDDKRLLSLSSVKTEGASSNANTISAPAVATTATEQVGQKRKRQNSIITENGKRKKVVDETAFHPDLQAALKELKVLIAKESWENKGKFPPALKPALSRLAILAIRLDEYDDDFFSLMPALFPYNKFTMTKLIKRTVFPEHHALLTERQDTLLAQLKQLAQDGFAKAEEEWEKSVIAWDKRQEKMRNEAAEASTGTGTGSAAPTRHPTEEMDSMDVDAPPSHTHTQPSATQDGEGGKDGKDGGKDGKEGKDGHGAHPPAKRYRMTDQMKSIVWELVLLSNECCRLENEKNSLEGSVIQISDQGARKVLYQKIVSAYPDGWMSSGQISRDVSAMKKRLEREAMEAENDD